MNGLRLPQEMLTPKDIKTNIFEMRNEVYKQIQKGMLGYIDDMFSVCEADKKEEILQRKNQITPIKNSLYMVYKGVELPVIDKSEMILDGIGYIPTMQIVDKPINSQKNGKFIVVKTNMRYCLAKMLGNSSNIQTKTGHCPLFTYLLYSYNNDVLAMLTDLGYEITEKEDEAKYFIPNYDDVENLNFIMVRECEEGKWKHYLLTPYTKENKDWHEIVYNLLKEEIEKYAVEADDDTTPEIDDDPTSKTSEDYLFKNDEASKLEKLRKDNMTEFEKELSLKVARIIYCYYLSTKKGKKSIKKSHLVNTLHKFVSEDMTLKNISVLGIVHDCVINDSQLPKATDIGDLSQKMIRFLEWYALKLVSVRSFPEKSMVMEVAKTEQKLVYNNTCNPLSELSVMSRANLFGKGGLPRESCQSNVRNLHDSYFGIIDPCDTPSGANVGISLHVVPEIQTFDFEEAIKTARDTNIFKDNSID